MSRFRKRLAATLAAAFLVPTALPAQAAALPIAAPADLRTTSVGNSSVALAWTPPATGPRPDHFRVYDGDTVVARNTTGRALVTGLAMMSTHTFRVTSVARSGAESPAAGPLTVSVYIPGMQPQCQPGQPVLYPAVTALTSSAVALTWAGYRPGTAYRVVGAGQDVTVTEPQIRLGGLTPGQSYPVQVGYRDCRGTPYGGSVQVTTPAGPAERPGSPADVVVSSRSDSTVALTWTAAAGDVRSYAVYRGATLLGTTTSTTWQVTRLWRGDRFTVTVAAVGPDGAESVHSAPLTVAPAACDDVPPRPEALTATAVSASSVELRWLSRTEALSYTVLDGSRVVASVTVPSARVTGLRSASTHRFAVRTELPDGCGTTEPSRRAPATTAAGPAARPAAPTGVQPVYQQQTPGAIGLQWAAPAGAPVPAYRVYEGATLIGESFTTTFSAVVPPATVHRLTVVSVDSARAESVPSEPVTVTGFYYPLP